jgi:large subunit ribosomal protein L24
MAGLFVKKGDTVQVIAGKDYDPQHPKKGRVILADPDTNRVIVEGINRITKHTKVTQSARGTQQGGIIHQEASIHASNVMVVCPNCDKPTRIGRRKGEPGEDGKARSIRVCKRCDGVI